MKGINLNFIIFVIAVGSFSMSESARGGDPKNPQGKNIIRLENRIKGIETDVELTIMEQKNMTINNPYSVDPNYWPKLNDLWAEKKKIITELTDLKSHDSRFTATVPINNGNPYFYQDVFPENLSSKDETGDVKQLNIRQQPTLLNSTIVAFRYYRYPNDNKEIIFKVYLKKSETKALTWGERQKLSDEQQRLLKMLWSERCAGIEHYFEDSCIGKMAGSSDNLRLFPVIVKMSGLDFSRENKEGVMACTGTKDSPRSTCKIVFYSPFMYDLDIINLDRTEKSISAQMLPENFEINYDSYEHKKNSKKRMVKSAN